MLPLSYMEVLLRYQLYRSAKEEYLNQKVLVEFGKYLNYFLGFSLVFGLGRARSCHA